MLLPPAIWVMPLPRLTMRPAVLSTEAAWTARLLPTDAVSRLPWTLLRAPPAVTCRLLADWIVPPLLLTAPATVALVSPLENILPPTLLSDWACRTTLAPEPCTVASWPPSLLIAAAVIVKAPPADKAPLLLKLAPACWKLSVPALLMAPRLPSCWVNPRLSAPPAPMVPPAWLSSTVPDRDKAPLPAIRPPLTMLLWLAIEVAPVPTLTKRPPMLLAAASASTAPPSLLRVPPAFTSKLVPACTLPWLLSKAAAVDRLASPLARMAPA